MEFRYHPHIEGLKVSEDGSVITLNGEPMVIKKHKLPHTRNVTLRVHINRNPVNVIKLVCEAWHGISPSPEHATRRIDEQAGNHYSNLYWGKKGMTISSAKGVIQPTAKMSMEVYHDIMEKSQTQSIKSILREYHISENRFYQFRKKHVIKNQ